MNQDIYINQSEKAFIKKLEELNIEQIQKIYNENPQIFINSLIDNQIFFFLDSQLQQKIICSTKIDPKLLFDLSTQKIDNEIQSFDIFFNNSYADENLNYLFQTNQSKNENENTILSLINEKQTNFKKEELEEIMYSSGYKSISSLLYEYIIQSDSLNDNIIEMLLELGANINVITKNEHYNLLMICLERNQIETAKFLIEKGININCINNDGDNSLSIAAKRQQLDIIRILLSKNCSLPPKFKYLPIPVNLEKYIDIRNEFNQYMIPINEEDDKGNILLHYVCMIPNLTKDNSVFQNIFKQTVEINHQNKDGITPIGYCMQLCNIEMIEFFMNYFKQNNSTLINDEVNLLFFILKQRAFEYAIHIFDSLSPYFDSMNEKYQTPLFYSVIYNYGKGKYLNQFDNNLFFMLLQTGLYDLTSTDYYERSLLHYAGMRKNSELYSFLLSKEVKENEKDYEEKTAKEYFFN